MTQEEMAALVAAQQGLAQPGAAGMVGQGARTLMGRQAALQAAEQAAMGGGAPPTQQAAPANPAALQQQKGLARLLRMGN